MRMFQVTLSTLILAILLIANPSLANNPTLTDTQDQTTWTFTPDQHTDVNVEDGTIIFEGSLSGTTPLGVTAALDSNGYLLATAKLLMQINLFDDLPEAVEIGEDTQGAFAALRNQAEETTGTVNLWGVDNSETKWIPMISNETPVTLNHQDFYYITMIFRYPEDNNPTPGPEGPIGGNNAPDPITYQVQVTPQTSPGDTAISQTITSPMSEGSGIAALQLFGTGALSEIGSKGGDPIPLSSEMGLAVYQSGNKVVIELHTVSEDGNSPIIVFARINGEWQEVGRVTPVGSGSNSYVIDANNLLIPGNSYLFKVEDEAGNTFHLTSELEVKSIRMDAVKMEMDMLTVYFNTEAGMRYKVITSSDLTAPATEWKDEPVSYETANGMSEVCNKPFNAFGTRTKVRIPVNKQRGFFKIIKLTN